MGKDYEIIAAKFGLGAQLRATSNGPSQLLFNFGLPYEVLERINAVTPEVGLPSLPYIVGYCQSLAKRTAAITQNGNLPIVIGGDHSIAVGTWSGIAGALEAEEKFGLIWIDAHMDSHTYESSPSKAYHGMPVAALLGFGNDDRSKVYNDKIKISPKHLCLIGIRSYEPEERELLEKLGIKVFYMQDIAKQGIKNVLAEAIKITTTDTKAYGISIDIDYFDPIQAPGVGSPEAHGGDLAEFLQALGSTNLTDKFSGLEIVEFNPERDHDNLTKNLALEILQTFIDKLNDD